MAHRQLLNSNQGKTSRIASKLGAAAPEFESFSANAAAFRQQMQQQAGVTSSTTKPNPAPKTESKKKPTEKVAERKQEIKEQADAQRQEREANAAMRALTKKEKRAARQAEREAAERERVAALEAKEAQRKEGIRIASIVKIGWQTLALNAKASKENAESKIQATLKAGKLPNDTQQGYLQDFKVAVDQLKTFVENASNDQLPKKIEANLLPEELKSSQTGQKQSISEQCQEILAVHQLAYNALEQSIKEVEELQKQAGQLEQKSAQLDQHKGKFAKQTAKPATSSTWCCCFGNKDSKPQAQAQTPAQESMDNDAHTALLSPRSNNRS